MTDCLRPLSCLVDTAEAVVSLRLVSAEQVRTAAESLPAFARAAGFKGTAGAVCLIPAADGSVQEILAGTGDGTDRWATAALSTTLPEGTYALSADVDPATAAAVALGWELGGYAFDRYKSKPAAPRARLVWPQGVDRAEITRQAEAVMLVRDLVNTPAEDMGPAALEAAVRSVASRHGAVVSAIVGDDLLAQNYPVIHAVGRAAAPDRAPRLIDLSWGPEEAPKLTLVGKGVCFDTGGLDLKGAGPMRLMKKDMGGAAHALGLAHLVMAAGLPVRLRVLIAAVENSVSGSSMRPGDVFRSRKGLTVEVTNTDAEGRLILCDALAEADAGSPQLLLDFATLTGAARVALGPDLPALFTNDDSVAADWQAAGMTEQDPVWRMPLWAGYRSMLDSPVADLDNSPEGGMAGSITAALFLQEFVSASTPWAHLDVFAWNPKGRAGRPAGGEALGLRSVWAMVRTRFAS